MMTDTLRKLFGDSAWVSGEEILEHIPLVFPNQAHEYTDPLFTQFSSCTDYGKWNRVVEKEMKEKNLSKEESLEFALDYFKEDFGKERHQTCQLTNKQGDLAKEIHVLVSSNGYRYQPYWGEGKKLTTDEKIEKLRSNLCRRTLEAIDSHFTNDHLKRLLKGRNGIKTTRPKDDGLDYFIWRHTRFNCGIDMTMPIIADWELDKFLKNNALDHEKKDAKDLIDLTVFKKNTEIFGKKSFRGAITWSRALGW